TSIGDACALLDMAALAKYVGKPLGTPKGDSFYTPTLGYSMACLPLTENGSVLLNMQVTDGLDMAHQLYNDARADGLGTTGSGVTTAEVSGIGEDAFQVIHEPNKGNTQKIGCSVGFLTANVVATVDVDVSEDNGTGRDKLAEICQDQARIVLGRLK